MSKNSLLVAINAKYIHTNLAVRYLKAFCHQQHHEVTMKEFSINDNIGNILRELYDSSIDIYAFSCYIWNIEMVLKLCSSLKRINPHAVIVLGGPEVSFDAEQLMAVHPYIDFILRGEGEETLLELLLELDKAAPELVGVRGITYRSSESIVSNPDRPLLNNLDAIPFPYEELDQLNNKIIYYETSRGCPFNCQYCLSSTLHGVRYFSMDRIKQEIKFFVDKGVKQVKLVDRTFNCSKRHSLEIIRYIIELKGATNFHFEIGADLLDEEMIEALAKAPKDMFQFEIGVQSTNERALSEASRTMNLSRLKHNVLALQKAGNSHMHLDLIAGLPYEDYQSFHRSFDEVHALRPDMLQLGFLKLLKGSGIRSRAEEYGIAYNSFSPYEVLKTRWISFEELNTLKEIEHLLELYYNSGRFRYSLSYIFESYYPSYFDFYDAFADYWRQHNLFTASQSTKELYNILCRFMEHQGHMTSGLNELIKLDWLLYYNSGNMPEQLKRYPHGSIKNLLIDYIKTEKSFQPYIADPKNPLKNISYEVFYTDVLHNPEVEKETVLFFIHSPKNEIEIISRELSFLQN